MCAEKGAPKGHSLFKPWLARYNPCAAGQTAVGGIFFSSGGSRYNPCAAGQTAIGGLDCTLCNHYTTFFSFLMTKLQNIFLITLFEKGAVAPAAYSATFATAHLHRRLYYFTFLLFLKTNTASISPRDTTDPAAKGTIGE